MRVALGLNPTLPQLVAALAASPRPVLLQGRWGLPDDAPPQARTLIAAADPERLADASAADPFAALDDVPKLLGEPPAAGFVGGGWIGWLGYELGRRVEPTLGPQPPRPQPLPAAALGWYASVLRRDEQGAWWAEGLADAALAPAAAAAWIDGCAQRWRDALAAARPLAPATLGAVRLAGGGADGHRAAVAETVARITAGELFQANVCLRLEAQVRGETAGLVAGVLDAADPWFGAWMHTAGGGLLSASPELFLRRRGQQVRTAPIKGTAPRRAADPSAQGPQALRGSAKDAAEHVMIVDLMRNDLGRVCDYGSIVAEPEPRVEAHAGVWHLVSHVTGRLHEGLGDGRLVRACFPPGSVTGAPKVQAQRVIGAVEATGREAYTGAHGIASPACGLELAVTIRSIEYRGQTCWIGVGGGIVADSTPDGELDEALAKAAALVAAAGGALPERGDSARPPASGGVAGARWLPSATPRPDPAGGLIETTLVTDGHPEHLARHLARLERSTRACGLAPLPAGLAGVLRARAAGSHGRRRLRIELRPGAVPRLELLPIGDVDGPPLLLSPWVVPGGLGAHKWADRRLLAALQAACDGTPLLLEADGSVLEAAWANVWWLDGAVLRTPPADGRLLPGISREVLLELAQVEGLRLEEGAATLGQLAGRPLLVSSTRGVQAARLASTPAGVIAEATALAATLGAALSDPVSDR